MTSNRLFAETKIEAFAQFLAAELPKSMRDFHGIVIIIREPLAGRYTLQLFGAFSPADSEVRRNLLKAEVEERIRRTPLFRFTDFVQQAHDALVRNANNLPALVAEYVAIQTKFAE